MLNSALSKSYQGCNSDSACEVQKPILESLLFSEKHLTELICNLDNIYNKLIPPCPRPTDGGKDTNGSVQGVCNSIAQQISHANHLAVQIGAVIGGSK